MQDIMRLKNLYDPEVVYEDYFEAYFIRPFIHHYVDFEGSESVRSMIKSLLCWLVLTLGVAGILTGLVGLLGPESGFPALWIIGGLWILGSLPGLASLVTRGLKGGSENEEPHPRFLGIDALLAGICVLFFIFGILMMVTTLRSETLNPNDNYDPRVETTMGEKDSVWEEPIFTYQDETPAMTPEEPLDDETEEEASESEDSFDPALETEAQAIADSLQMAGE